MTAFLVESLIDDPSRITYSVSTMNHLGNIHSSFFANSYQYENADGSRYFSNPDGSAYYDPGTSGKGKKWFRDPNGEKHFLSDSDSDDTVYLESSRITEPKCD